MPGTWSLFCNGPGEKQRVTQRKLREKNVISRALPMSRAYVGNTLTLVSPAMTYVAKGEPTRRSASTGCGGRGRDLHLDAGPMIALLANEPGADVTEGVLTEPGSACYAH